ncbi:MAG: oligosaccharide repeat unit polymerase [Candidatus Marinimicrobia bacterium]|jgi:oligosaccharide repeat unit polymerase|nr:oligosaccharide repeat unit polymerase [Candidatus Neomarinimicrobiota bacterium]MBT4064286.1 oligosaccharide repeat unit polymerase [Candidatus Neomarinimicrobiota bacterium]MBT4382839.1 oligosaccharide repeat unit polymerase [Candidatus Neomarinimicrobiota bacterium]MBT4637094.1 oligosaccharide repeat unit polymerase [Candidatus Neomarinimicrobiota bacterium]MBT5758850.1 oligosaccharide repeat unit polymerase [Candidatus Neomarinimicrobiota bacterium]
MVILPFLAMLATAGITSKITKSWLSPGAFFACCWSFFLLVPLIFTPEYKTDQFGLWYVAIFTMACAAGSIVAFRELPERHYDVHGPVYGIDSKILYYSFLGLNLISLIGLVLLFRHASATYNFGYYANSWMSIPNLIAIDRYSGYINYPFIIKYSLYCIYPANLIGGLLLGLTSISNRNKILTTIPLFLALFLGIIEGARTSILLGLVLFFSSWMSAFMVIRQAKTKENSYLKFILGSGFLIVSFTGFFILIQWLRQGMDTIIVDLLLDRIRAYFFGYLSAFTQWAGQIDQLEITAGLTTFAGPFNLAGIIERPLGFYGPVNISNGISTNIFTAFRGLINDFSIAGSICIAFVLGFILQLIFQNRFHQTLIKTIPISMFYAFTLYSPLISIFHYNSIFFSWFVISIPLFMSKNEPVANYR